MSEDQDIRNRIQEYVRLINAGEIMTDFIASDIKIYPPGQDVICGYEAVLQILKEMINKGERVDIDLKELQVAGDWAWATDSYAITHKDGTLQEKGRAMLILKKSNQSGLWELYREIFNTDEQ